MGFVLAAVGDVMVTRSLDAALRKPGVRSVQRILGGVDYVVGNLEIPLCDGGRQQEKMVAHRASPAIAPYLAQAGFRCLVLAINHEMDYGAEGLLETISHLRGSGIEPIGGGANLREALRVHYAGSGDTTVGFFAISSLLPLGAAATADRPGIAPVRVETSYCVDANLLLEQPGTPPTVQNEIHEEDMEAVISVIREARSRARRVVAFTHWGVGAQQERAPYQQVLGRRLIDEGVDVVLGCHPHTIQEIERYRDGYIFYNLGEFFSQYPKIGLPPNVLALLSQLQPEGYIARLGFGDDLSLDIDLIPLAIDPEGDPTIEQADHVASKITRLCEVECRAVDGALRLGGPKS
jgi:poly-gamma-glutamate synthesis protein (capsule biosynthesis protein)